MHSETSCGDGEVEAKGSNEGACSDTCIRQLVDRCKDVFTATAKHVATRLQPFRDREVLSDDVGHVLEEVQVDVIDGIVNMQRGKWLTAAVPEHLVNRMIGLLQAGLKDSFEDKLRDHFGDVG